MSMRVATFASSDRLLDAAMRVQARESEATMQQASGKQSSDYGGLGTTAGRVISLQSSVSLSKSYASAAATAGSRVEQMYDAVGSMIDLLTSIKSDTISFDEQTTGTGTLATTASGTLDQIVSLMNSKYDGRYLFAGSATDTAPVDVADLASQTVPTSADTSYYQGNDDVLSVKVSAEQTVSYGVTADAAPFEQAIRALSLLTGGATDSDTLSEANDLIADALDGLTTTQATLSVKASTLQAAETDQADYQTFATSVVSNLSDADVAAVASSLSTYQTQLKAAYSAIGTIRSLSLADYLK